MENETEIVDTEFSDYIENTMGIRAHAKFIDESLKENIIPKKRKRNEASVEAKRAAEEHYIEALQDQQYKRLMHLLNRSKFFSTYIVNKIDDNMKGKGTKVKRQYKKKAHKQDENAVQPEGKKRRSQDIRNYISQNVQEKIQMNKSKLNEEDIQNALVVDSDSDAESDNNNFEMPKYFNGTLRDYQIRGFKWLKVLYENGINGILADEMGLGKTVQVIALLCHLFENEQEGPYLIIVPLSTLPNWIMEFERFAPTLPLVVHHCPKNERFIAHKQIKQKYKVTDSYSSQPVVLSTFEISLMDKTFFKTQHWKYIIIDEGHRIKNHNCDLFKVLKSCKSMNRLIMTGTPLQNNLSELWALLNFLLPEIFDDLAVFESWFDAKALQYNEGAKKFLKLEEEKHVLASLREILEPFMLRREKSDVCLEIPLKKEVIICTPLSDLQHLLYKEVINRHLYEYYTNEDPSVYIIDGKRPTRQSVLKNMSNDDHKQNSVTEDESSNDSVSEGKLKDRLLSTYRYFGISKSNPDYFFNITRNRFPMYKKIVNHPYLVRYPLNDCGLPLIDENLVKASGKLLVLDAMLPKLKSQGHKVLLFSTMTTLLDVIEDYLSMRPYEYVRLDGGCDVSDRKHSIEEFNSNPNIFLFLLSTRAGGVGLNLTGADTVIMYDSDWNPQMDIQAMARCHRIGQSKPVVIYKFCTEGTIDEFIMNRAETKRVLEKMVISKKTKVLNLKNKETLLELQRFLESKGCRVGPSKNEVFTEDELNKLLDRSDLYQNLESKEP
ncbi:lymphoid-specific helicase [Nomia melanderi]|uniref:lymphoid-specific helicase n=1 Tax=Nomia melanderi TaxID=2448451 RepID=UPI00130419BF|nr:lymphocyte-specific helicase-like [Nomia melanderi]